jgi:signal transduction histidine kinase
VDFRATGREMPLPGNVNRQLVQIAREALANVAKHANPRHVRVVLDYQADACVLRIKDAGRGFEVSKAEGHGSSIMRERSQIIGAELRLISKPGEGTEITIVYRTAQGAP